MSDLSSRELMYDVASQGLETLRLPGPWIWNQRRELDDDEPRPRPRKTSPAQRAAVERVAAELKRARAKRRAAERRKRARWRERETRNAKGGGGYYAPTLILDASGLVLGGERRAAISIREAIIEAREASE